MKKIQLTKAVTITGPSFLGYTSSITFTPSDQAGWFLKTENGLIPIDHTIATHIPGNIKIESSKTTVKTWEHIGVLRFLGIDGIIISVPEKQKWPPYLGGAGAYYEKLIPYLRIQTNELPTMEVVKENKWKYKKRNGAYVYIEESGVYSALELFVDAKWKNMPRHHEYILINESRRQFLIDKILSSKPQGFPHSRYNVAKIASMFGWPNFKNVAWKKDFSSKDSVAYWWWLHRVQDLLGALSLCSHTDLPIGKVYSVNAGHEADLHVVKTAFSF